MQDIAYERKVQREMESDENKFEDKESFVTAAYKKTLEERKEMEETLRKEEELDSTFVWFVCNATCTHFVLP